MRLVAEHVRASVQLDPPRPVVEIDERRLAVTPARVDAAGHSVGVVGLLAVPEVVVRGVDARDRDDARELVRERLDAVSSGAVGASLAGPPPAAP